MTLLLQCASDVARSTLSDTTCQYIPLAECEIRLVRVYSVPTDDQAQVLHDSGHDELCIDLLHVPLETAPGFVAVSYTTGDISEPAKVSIGGGLWLHSMLPRGTVTTKTRVRSEGVA